MVWEGRGRLGWSRVGPLARGLPGSGNLRNRARHWRAPRAADRGAVGEWWLRSGRRQASARGCHSSRSRTNRRSARSQHRNRARVAPAGPDCSTPLAVGGGAAWSGSRGAVARCASWAGIAVAARDRQPRWAPDAPPGSEATQRAGTGLERRGRRLDGAVGQWRRVTSEWLWDKL